MVYQLIYTSKMRSGMGEKTINKIVMQSRERNQAHNITGMLLCANDVILQIIEGERHEVEALYRQITRDTRHREVMILADQETDVREFKNTPMQVKFITSAKGSAEMNALIKNSEMLSLSA